MSKAFQGKFLRGVATVLVAAAILAATAMAQQSSTGGAATSAAQKPAASAAAKPAGTAKPAGSAAPAAHSVAPKGAAAAPELTTEKQKASYAFGLNVGRKLIEQPVDLDNRALLSGIRDAVMKNKAQMTDDQVRAALEQLAKEANAKEETQNQSQQAQLDAMGEANLKEGTDFLAGNKTKDGVVALPSGLQYKILTAGTGPKPGADDTVICDYSGTLIDGKEFDSSYKRGQPATFPVNRVIKGWTEALQLMPVGSKWQLFIPADLAYGPRGAGADIGPNATLIFEVELHSIQGK